MTAAMVATAVVATTALLLVATQTVSATLFLLVRDVNNFRASGLYWGQPPPRMPRPSALGRVVLGASCQRAARRHWAERTARPSEL